MCDATGEGRTRGQAWELDGVALWPADAAPTLEPGDIFRARVTGADGFDLSVVPVPRGTETA
ncbi:MAG: hypothetical protein GF400_09850 [Candidatus Eisenbacteria bacterium]|nr:hypothetical protein [Candidatus Eisenbacteria bacterium]